MNERSREKNEPRRGGRFYTAILPTDFPTKLEIIFSWMVALNSVGNVRRYFLNFVLKFWKSLQIFWSLLANPSVNRCQSMRALHLTLPSVTVSTDLTVWQSHTLEFALFVGKSVGDCGINCNVFATLGKILTRRILSIWSSVIVENAVICFQLLVKYRRDIFRRYSHR